MSKKNYTMPAITVISVTPALMVPSITGTNQEKLGAGGKTSTEGITSGNSRGASTWDDEY